MILQQELIDFSLRARKDFPLLAADGGLSYLDNAATTQKPAPVLDAMENYYRSSNANVHRGVYRLAEAATAAYEGARARVARWLGTSTNEVVFTPGATAGINQFAESFAKSLCKLGDVIVLSEMEHHANLVPWQMAAKKYSLRLKFVPFDRDGELDEGFFDTLEGEPVRLVALCLMSNVLGTWNDMHEIAHWCRDHKVPLLVDAAQAAAHGSMNVADIECDALVLSGHKMYGPTGIGVLWVRMALLEQLEPAWGGGDMIRAVWLDRAEWNDIPWRFEAGTPNVAGAVGLAAALDYLEALGSEKIIAAEQQLVMHSFIRLGEVPGLKVYGNPVRRGPVFSFNLEGVHPHDLAQFLDREGIAVRSGHHCAHPLMRKLGVEATARASYGLYNSPEEIDRLAKALIRAGEYFKRGI